MKTGLKFSSITTLIVVQQWSEAVTVVGLVDSMKNLHDSSERVHAAGDSDG